MGFQTAKLFRVPKGKYSELVDGYLHTQIYENVNEYHIDKAITDLIFEFVHFHKVDIIMPHMVFDSFGTDSNYIQIVNEHQIKALQSCQNGSGRRESIRMKFAMPTANHNEHDITSVSWVCDPTKLYAMGDTSYHALGVVSNRTTEMTHAYFGLKDCHGVQTTYASGFVYKGAGTVQDSAYAPLTKNMSNGGWKMKVTYLVNESKLQFERVDDDGAIATYVLDLPTGVQDFTHWHPFIS